MTPAALLLSLGQGLLCLALAPFTVGALQRVKTRLQRRTGPTLWQPYRDLGKLLRKRSVMPHDASWVFHVAPAVVFACYGALGFLAPTVFLAAQDGLWTGDLLVLVYLLGLARLTLGLAGMAAGAPFGGLGSSRELFLHALAEPTLILIVGTLALRWHTADLAAILRFHHSAPADVYTTPALLLLLLALWLAVLIEAGRLPFDNPASHLELTMFGKAIYLEYAGPQLALLEWAEWTRLTFLLTLLANLFVPWLLAAATNPWWLNIVLIALYPFKLYLLAAVLAVWEVLQVKLRLRAVVTPALTALVITLLAAVLAVAIPGTTPMR